MHLEAMIDRDLEEYLEMVDLKTVDWEAGLTAAETKFNG
jgi:hypothetical protein